jgi:putative FmdB family regulatory protein
MPLYEYTCSKCDSEFELLIRGDEQPECPQCGSHRLEKQLSVPAAHMAGADSLPVCPSQAMGTCGLPECGAGRCAFGA